MASKLSSHRSGGGGGHDYEQVDQDFEAQDEHLLGSNNDTSNLRSRNNYQHDERSDEYEVSNDYNSDEDDLETIQRRRRKYMNTSIGDLYRNNSSHNNNSSLSFNFILTCLLGFLLIFGLGYYVLGKNQQRSEHANEVEEQKELERLKVKYGLVEEDGKEKATIVQHQIKNEPTLEKNSKENQQHEIVTKPHLSEHFDPFHLHNNNPKINSHTNDWFGAPFIVSPPQLPSFTSNNENADEITSHSARRLGYFQYPTIFNSTLVFSSEGELYLTRIPTTLDIKASMTAMKLTTTAVGSAIHPKLNHKYPHLLVYSATYSGVREVYLLNLRGIVTNDGGIPMNVPGSPGGPAVRLTYTTGGIESVVGWDEDGTTILYSARSDQASLPDIRLFRLRLSSVGGAAREAGSNDASNVGDEVSAKKGEGEYAAKEGGEDNSHVDQSVPTELTMDESSQHNTSSADATGETESNHETKDDDQRRRLNRNQEQQRRRASKLLLSSQSRRGVEGSSIHPIIEPVPLSEAVEGVCHSTIQKMSSSEMHLLTRAKQSAYTKRYVGGTAESLWSYCPGEFDDLAIPLTEDYNGTSKSPTVYSHGGRGDWIFFISDRAVDNTDSNEGANQTKGWAVSSMDLWAAQLPITSSGFSSAPIRLTNVACQYNGMELMEYSVDQFSGGVALRIGADLHYMPMDAIQEKLNMSEEASESRIHRLPIAVYSDFSSMQERIIPLQVSKTSIVDAYATSYGVSALLTSSGQTFVVPVIPDTNTDIGKMNGKYGGGGINMPSRRYKVAPGTGGEGLVRILCAINIPHSTTDSGERNALVLATDPLSPTGEHAFYIIRTDAMASPTFGFTALLEADTMEEKTGLPIPIWGGHLNSGGNSSIFSETVAVSPCGRRFAFINTDGQIVAATMPIHSKGKNRHGRHVTEVDMTVLPQENEIGQPMVGSRHTNLVFSPGGRYLVIEHFARNAFKVISIADLGSTVEGHLKLGRIVQVTPDRFNSFSAVWGRESNHGGATALFFLSDRDGDTNTWGARAPTPRLDSHSSVHVLPLRSMKEEANEANAFFRASFGGGGVSEIFAEEMKDLDSMLKASTKVNEFDHDDDINSYTTSEEEPWDAPINFEDEKGTSFKSYRLDSIPAANYVKIVCQLPDEPSLVIVTKTSKTSDDLKLSLLATDRIQEVSLYDGGIEFVDLSTDRVHVLVMVSGELQVVPRTAAAVLSLVKGTNVAAMNGLHVSIWPALEYQQNFADSWRLLRDYFYDDELHQIDWDEVFDRYLPLVERCSKREELEDIIRQMGGELSAVHVLVNGAEHEGHTSSMANEIASLGAMLRRSTEMNGYEIIEILERDPDFHMTYSPLSEQVLRLSGQQALKPGDVIIGVNGEHVINVPSINMLLRGKAGESVRLEVQRVTSNSKRLLEGHKNDEFIPAVSEPLMVVPLSAHDRNALTYAAWEWKTRERAKTLAAEAGFTLGYIHLQDMSGASEGAFARGFFPDHDKQALIVDVRHCGGGKFYSWLLDTLQHKAFWRSRADIDSELMWDEQVAFRAHLVVLMDETTSADAEAFASSVSEIGLGKIVGKRSRAYSYNEYYGWGVGIEQLGIVPDVEVDNNPRDTFEGRDAQLEMAISVLKEWLKEEEVELPRNPARLKMKRKKNSAGCSA